MKMNSITSLMALTISLSVLSTHAFAHEEKASVKTHISGLIEVEAGITDDASDTTLATVELGIDHVFTSTSTSTTSNKVTGHALFLFEEGENNDNITVDEAIIYWHPSKNLNIAIGRMYVPFGLYHSHMISDPFTLEIGESREETLQLHHSSEKFSSAIYVFKDNSDGSGNIDDFGASFDYQTDSFKVGINYISDVNEASTTTSSAKGLAVHASTSFGRTSIIVEHVAVSSVAGVKPNATYLEISFDLGNNSNLALATQKTNNSDATTFDLPEKAFGIAYSMPIFDKAGFATEVMKNEAYDGTDDTVVTLQLTYAF